MVSGDCLMRAPIGDGSPYGVASPAAPERPTPTIYALATGAPPAAIAIVRVSGPRAIAALRALTAGDLPAARRMTRVRLVEPTTHDPLDDALAVVFPAPASVTGDDLVELHLHGGVAVVDGVLAALGGLGLTAAGPGAFTRRAFDNGKVDLGQVEAFGDLVAAETGTQRRAALSRTGSRLAERVAAWRAALIGVRSDVEATLDFADEDHVAPDLTPSDRVILSALLVELASARADADRAGRLRDGIVVAITGPVNAGKSTLLNALARRDAAMVSPLPGTTRDTIEVRVVLAGVPVTLIDTAGLRESDDALEVEGIRRGRARAASADLVIAMGSEPAVPSAIWVEGKSDLGPCGAGWRDGALHLSAMTGDGVEMLERELIARVGSLTSGEAPLVAHRWQAAAIVDAVVAIESAIGAGDAVVAAEELRVATHSLARLVGRVSSDDILDGIFARFCIGK